MPLSLYADIGSDSLRLCFTIIEAYVVLCAASPDLFMQVERHLSFPLLLLLLLLLFLYLQNCAEITATACSSYLEDVKPEGVLAIVQVE